MSVYQDGGGDVDDRRDDRYDDRHFERREGLDRDIRVLHLDDEPGFVEMAAEMVERAGDRIEVVTSTDPEAALDRLERERFDCVVSDYQMPRATGLEFLRRVRDRYPDLPFLLFTGKGSEELAGEAISAGVTDYLQKEGGTEQYTVLANRIENTVAQYRAERRVEETNRRIRQVHERITDAVVALDDDWRYTYVNQQAEELLQRDETDLLGETLWEAFPGVEDSAFGTAFREAMETQEPRTAEAYFDPLGTWFEVRVYPDEAGLSIYFRDVSERREHERRYEAIFNNTFQFTGLLEPDGTLVEANETALEFGGLEREDVVGEKMWDAYWFQRSEEVRERARRDVERAAEGELVRRELEVQGADGPVVIDFSIKPVTDETGEVVLLVPEGRDITALKQRERELERQNQRLEEFASVVSHDLRNPLMVARGNVELARDTGDPDHLEQVESALDRMDDLIENLLALAEQGQVVDEPGPVDLRATVEEAVANAVLDEASVTIECPPDLVVTADRKRLVGLLENLLANAATHGGDDASVRVGVDRDTLYVADDGPGIPPGEREDVFTPGHSTGEDGNGFGLSIVRSIARAHGWTVDVTESAAGGARFEVRGLERV